MNNPNTSNGLGVVGLFQAVFITLKLTNYVTWSWFWVLSPLWINAAIVLSLLLIVFLSVKQ